MSPRPDKRILMDMACMALAGGVPESMYRGAAPQCLPAPWALS